jgi:hypothetical protein
MCSWSSSVEKVVGHFFEQAERHGVGSEEGTAVRSIIFPGGLKLRSYTSSIRSFVFKQARLQLQQDGAMETMNTEKIKKGKETQNYKYIWNR